MQLTGKVENPLDVEEMMRKAPGMFQGLQELSAQLQETPTTQLVNRVTSLLLFAKGKDYVIWTV